MRMLLVRKKSNEEDSFVKPAASAVGHYSQLSINSENWLINNLNDHF